MRGGPSAAPACSWGDVWVAGPFDDKGGSPVAIVQLGCLSIAVRLRPTSPPIQFRSVLDGFPFTASSVQFIAFFLKLSYGCVVVILHLVSSHCGPLWP